MATLEGKAEIVPSLTPTTETAITLVAKDFDAAGRAIEYSAPMPLSSDFEAWSLMQQIVMLKRGMWKTLDFQSILWGLSYGKRIGADPIKGEIFPTGEGRWGTSNKYKIKAALATGNVAGIETQFKVLDDPINFDKCVLKKDLECTATIQVRGWDKPIVRTARLSRWYKPSNPNWQGNPEHMLELNTVAHACEYVPGASLITEDDEAPPSPLPAEAALEQSIQTARGGK